LWEAAFPAELRELPPEPRPAPSNGLVERTVRPGLDRLNPPETNTIFTFQRQENPARGHLLGWEEITMTKLKLLVLGAAVALAVLVPDSIATSATGTDRTNAARACKALRSSLGATMFTQTFATSESSVASAYGKCVSQFVRLAAQARQQATKACVAQKLTGSALKTCVTSKTKTLVNQKVSGFKNAAKACAAERASMGDTAFKDKYGTNADKSNAFGKCVSSLVSQGAANKTQVFHVSLTAVNSSGVTGTATLRLKGTQLTVTINATGLTPNQVHLQHIHEGASCASAGTPVLDLTPFPTADTQGRISYKQTFTISSSLLPLTDRTLNLHGMNVGGTYDPGIIVACGQI